MPRLRWQVLRCGEPGHRSNEFPKRKQVNLADYEDDAEEEVEIEDLDETDFVEEQGDFVACVVQRLLCNQKAPNTTQRHQIFYLRCSIKTRYAFSSLIMEAKRTSCLKHL